MTFNEFWAAYHREDPDEALEHPHRLRIVMKDGRKYEGAFPGSVLASSNFLTVGVRPNKKGICRTAEYCNWADIEKVELKY